MYVQNYCFLDAEEKMMLKIGNTRYETYSIKNCNFKNQLPYIFVTPIEFDRCPICGELLKKDYVYGIQISKTECVKIRGNVCYSCKVLFNTYKFLLEKLEKIRINKDAYELRKDYLTHYNKEKYMFQFSKTKSAFKQYTIAQKGLVESYTVVYDMEKVNKDNHIIHYTDKIALTLIRSERNNDKFVQVNGKEYAIVNIKTKRVADEDINRDIENVVLKKIYFDDQIPELSTKKTVYVYNGNISCHKKHCVEEFRAEIEILGRKMYFYVEYCYDCDKFLIKYNDYKEYLKKYKFFPAKMNYYGNRYDDYDRAEKSPLYLNGYTVSSSSDLATSDRQYILEFVMKYGILTKRKVLDYLEIFINTNGNKRNMEWAVARWKSDKEFVLNYELDEKPIVCVGKIERRK